MSDDQLDLWIDEPPQDRLTIDDEDEDDVRVYQLTELPGHTWEDIFGDAA